MVDPRASRFWMAATQSGLADDAALQACWDAIPDAKRTPDAVDRRLARQAVNAGLVTVWQAQQLMTGRATGFKIDRYVLLDLIGQGGMGRVYLARDTRLSRRVAIKVLSRERMANPRAITRFQREAKVGAQLQHENLVRIYDEGESANIRYLVMEFIDGKNVAQLIGEQGSIPWRAAARLTRQVALGLEHAQLKGLIHRDVNPANILVTHDGTAKLTDLGLAIDLADEASVTRDGATVGTFDYISPEQAKHSRDVDTRADIYSLGCTIYHMITGRVPFVVPSLPEKLYAHQLHDAEPVNQVVKDVPEALAQVVQRMMAKSPADRYQTPAAVALALEPFDDDAARVDPNAPASRSTSGETAATQTKVVAPVRGVVQEAGAAEAPVALAEAPILLTPESIVPTSPLPEAVSDPDLAAFALNIGPEELISSSSRSKASPKPKKAKVAAETPALPETGTEPKTETESKTEKPVPTPKPKRKLELKTPALVGIGLVLVLAALFVIAAVVAASKKRLEGPPDEDLASRPANTSTKPLDPTKLPAISVVSAEEVREAATLAEAIAMAAGGGGDVVLNPSGPIRLDTAKEIAIPRGRVTIRGADGTVPILAIDATGSGTLLLGTPGTSLTLRGLRVLVRYGSAAPSALIESGGTISLEKCTFLAEGTTAKSRLVKSEGPKLTVDGCLIAGFDRSLDVEALPSVEVIIRQSVIARVGGSDPSPGWAVRVQYAGISDEKPNAKPRRITFDHVTIRAGLLELVDFSETTSLSVTLDHVAVQGRALLAWTPTTGQSPEGWTKALKWTGNGNRYDVTGTAWVVLSADAERPAPNAPGDLAAWSAALPGDKGVTAQSFKFSADPAALAADPAAIEPGQFALKGEGVESVGADVKKVGANSGK